MARVSICLPTRNRSLYLEQTLPMILQQTFKDFELIICNDASTDNTEEIVMRMKDPRIRYKRNTVALGVPAVLNECLRWVRGEYVLFLHDHDVYAPTLVEEMVFLLDEHPEVGFVHVGVYEVDENGRRGRSYIAEFPRVMRGRDLARLMLRGWVSEVCALSMVRRSCLDDVGAFDPRFGFISDTDLWVRLALKYDVGYIKKPLIGVRAREKDHPFALPNWQFPQWVTLILQENLKRLYSDDPLALRYALWKLRLRRDLLFLSTLFRCYYRELPEVAEEGLRVLERDRSVELRIAAFLLKRFAVLRAAAKGTARLVRIIRPK